MLIVTSSYVFNYEVIRALEEYRFLITIPITCIYIRDTITTTVFDKGAIDTNVASLIKLSSSDCSRDCSSDYSGSGSNEMINSNIIKQLVTNANKGISELYLHKIKKTRIQTVAKMFYTTNLIIHLCDIPLFKSLNMPSYEDVNDDFILLLLMFTKNNTRLDKLKKIKSKRILARIRSPYTELNTGIRYNYWLDEFTVVGTQNFVT